MVDLQPDMDGAIYVKDRFREAGAPIAPLAAYFIVSLLPSPNRTVSYDVLCERMRHLTGDYVYKSTLVNAAKQARRGIKKSGWQAKIESETLMGYRMEFANANWLLQDPFKLNLGNSNQDFRVPIHIN